MTSALQLHFEVMLETSHTSAAVASMKVIAVFGVVESRWACGVLRVILSIVVCCCRAMLLLLLLLLLLSSSL
jgi:hypothetical protein